MDWSVPALLVAGLVGVVLYKRARAGETGERLTAATVHPVKKEEQKVGPYTLIEEIGRGPAAVVYRAKKTKLIGPKKEVALRVFRPATTGIGDFAHRFYREMMIGKELDHPNIVKVIEGNEDDGLFYIALELVQGRSLEQFLNQGVPPLQKGLEMISELLKALDYAHRHKVVHRDIRPSAILVTEEGQLKVGEFGLGKTVGDVSVTEKGVFLGSAAYGAPELLTDGTAVADARADQYSAGMVAFEILTGRLPFEATGAKEITQAIVEKELPSVREINPEVPETLAHVVDTMLAKKPEKRYATISSALEVLEDIREQTLN